MRSGLCLCICIANTQRLALMRSHAFSPWHTKSLRLHSSMVSNTSDILWDSHLTQFADGSYTITRHCHCLRAQCRMKMSANVGRMTGITYMATSRWGGSAPLCLRRQSCQAVWGRACGSMKGPALRLCSQPAALPSGFPQTRRSAHCLPLIPSPAQSATKELFGIKC